jgi:hypothetical protein
MRVAAQIAVERRSDTFSGMHDAFPRRVLRYLLSVVIAVSLCATGCRWVPHFDAAYPNPDYVAAQRASRTFALERLPATSEYACTYDICVRGLRAQLERGTSTALAALATETDNTGGADYVARIDDLVLHTSVSRGYRGFGGPSLGQVGLTYRFTLTDAHTDRVVVQLSDTETETTAGGVSWARLLQRVEHEVVRRIDESVARSPLVAP